MDNYVAMTAEFFGEEVMRSYEELGKELVL
jgi:hypothetical protein